MKFHNTLTKSKELFEPINPGKVGMHTCAPTVYDFAQIFAHSSFPIRSDVYSSGPATKYAISRTSPMSDT